MPSSHLFRATVYATVCVATLSLWCGEDDPLPYPWVVLLCAVAAHAFTDHWQKLVIPSVLAPWLCVAVISLFAWEELHSFRSDPVLPLGHLLIYLQLNLFFHVKKPRYYWFMLFMSFLQMMIAAVHNSKLTFGLLLAAYVALALWSLTQFLLLRERQIHRMSQPAGQAEPIETGGITAWLSSSATILALAMVLFWLIPRQGRTAWTPSQYQGTEYISGFDDQIRLGQLGTILESNDEVMTVHLTDEAGQPYRPPDELLWRGVSLTRYRSGRWERKLDLPTRTSPWEFERPRRFIRQQIKLQPVHRDVLFALRPALTGYTQNGTPLVLSRLDGTIVRPESAPSRTLQYTIESPRDESHYQAGEYQPYTVINNPALKSDWIYVPEDMRRPLTDYVSALIPPEVTGAEEICNRLLFHLRDSGEFDYTLQETVVDARIDPVLDFLVNRREGHCEYFASALALLLRVREIPTRVINGFKGGDWNEFLGSKFLVVRQMHAHSWVEALVGEDENYERWITLDPTPGPARQRSVAQLNRTPAFLRQIHDFARDAWWSLVLNFNATEQEAMIYSPIRQLVTEQIEAAVTTLSTEWRSQRRSFNWVAALLSSASLAGLIFSFWLVARLVRRTGDNGARLSRPRNRLWDWIAKRLRRLLGRLTPDQESPRTRIAFYDQLVRALESHGISKPASWTPRQFARQAELVLQETPRGGAVSRIPAELVDHFYHVRFGNKRLSQAETEEIASMLQTLETELRD